MPMPRSWLIAFALTSMTSLACSKSNGTANENANEKKSETPTPSSAAPTAEAPATPTKVDVGSTHLAGKNFALDVTSTTCAQGQECTVILHLAPSGGYHVNKEFPYKFVATEAPGVEFLGKPEARTFSRASGDFHEDGETSATLEVRFKASSKGQASVSGTFKMSVCSAENCQVEQQPVALLVPVT